MEKGWNDKTIVIEEAARAHVKVAEKAVKERLASFMGQGVASKHRLFDARQLDIIGRSQRDKFVLQHDMESGVNSIEGVKGGEI